MFNRLPVVLDGNAQPFEQNEGHKWFDSIIADSYNDMLIGDIVRLKLEDGYFKILRFIIKVDSITKTSSN